MPSSIAASSSPSDDSHVSKSKSVSRSPPFRYRRRVSSRSRGRQSSRSPRRRRRNTSRSSTSRSSERHFRSSRRNGKSPNRYSRSPIRRRRSRSSSRESESRRRRHQYTPRRYHSRESSRSRSTSPKKRNTRQRLISRSRSPPDPRDSFLFKRRSRRMLILERGAPEVWGRSPVQSEIEEVYAAYLECEENKRNEVLKVEKLKETRNIERRMEEKKRRADVMKGDVAELSDDDSPVKKKKKKEKKAKKEKKSKKEKKKKTKKKKSKKQDSDSDEWVEVTHDMRLEEAAREAKEEQEIPGPALPEHLQSRNQLGVHIKANYGKDMLKGEAAAMAAYAARGERIPRRGEIGLSSAEISEFEKVGYVMSGTRHKAMEATRLRKENQVLTAEEKRLLSGFSQEERKKKEMAMLGQMRSLIASKRVE